MKIGKLKILLFALALAGAACGDFNLGASMMKSTPFYSDAASGSTSRTYTGRIEDRVNLWPLAYYREPAFSCLWPMISVTDDHIAVRPLYTQYRTRGAGKEYDEFNFLWPLCQFDTRRGRHRFFPLFWGSGDFDVFPILWSYFRENGYYNLTLFPLLWLNHRCDHTDVTLFPLYWHGRDFDFLLPLYYRDRDMTLLTPFFGCARDWSSYWVFPFCYGNDRGTFLTPLWCQSRRKADGPLDFWCLPLALSAGWREDGTWTDRYLLGLAGRSRGNAFSSSWCAPFYYANSDGLFATPLYGRTRTSQWVFPAFYRDDTSFYSWLWCQQRTAGTGAVESWLVPPLLTDYSNRGGREALNVLGGFGGYRHETKSGFSSAWTFPLFYRNNAGTLMTPLYGTYSGSEWAIPLYYRDKRTFLSPLWAQGQNVDYRNSTWWMIPPLFTGGGTKGGNSFYSPFGGWFGTEEEGGDWATALWFSKRSEDRSLFLSLPWVREWRKTYGALSIVPPLLSWYEENWFLRRSAKLRVLLGLYGHNSHCDNSFKDWLFPLYFYESDGDWGTLLFGATRYSDRVNRWWLTPLVGTTSGSKYGFWLFPLVDVSFDRRLPELERMMNAGTLDPSVTGKYRPECRFAKGPATRFETNWVFKVEPKYSADTVGLVFNLGGSSRTVCYTDWGGSKMRKVARDFWRESREKGKTVVFRDNCESGNFLLFKRESERVVNFDYDTREKLFDGYTSDTEILAHVLWSAHREVIPGKRDFSRMSILWRLWRYEATDGDVSMDVFPFITHDRKRDGSVKTSFLWRFFRYERKPGAGTAVDFLFIPVWR